MFLNIDQGNYFNAFHNEVLLGEKKRCVPVMDTVALT